MNVVVSVGAALAAAVAFAGAAVLQHESASEVPQGGDSPPLLIALLRRPKWLASIVVLVGGFGFQALALAYGPVALVEPVIVVELAIAIPLGIWRQRVRAGRREWLGIAAVIAGVSTFLVVAAPVEGSGNPADATWSLVLLPAGTVVAVLVAVAVGTSGRRRAVTLGAVSGIAFGVLSVFTKTTTYLLSRDLPGTFTHWQPYALVLTGLGALMASQTAYQAAPLAFSMPTSDVLEPITAVLIGDTALGEQVHVAGAAALAGQTAAAAVACVGIVMLATSPLILTSYASGGPRPSVGETAPTKEH